MCNQSRWFNDTRQQKMFLHERGKQLRPSGYPMLLSFYQTVSPKGYRRERALVDVDLSEERVLGFSLPSHSLSLEAT